MRGEKFLRCRARNKKGASPCRFAPFRSSL
nr:MAG TPA_asm: hypothetical protein [Caudoviricetes sp.]